MVVGARHPTVEMERNQGIQGTIYLDRIHRICGEWGVGEKYRQGLGAWVGFIRRGADLWGRQQMVL